MADDAPTYPPPAVIPGAPSRREATSARSPDAAFGAQVIGQEGRRRGLKGGRPVLDAAAATYLGTEWSGPSDRRRRAGTLRLKDV